MTATDAPAAPPLPRKRPGAFVVVLLLVGLAIVLAGVFPFRQLIAQERLVDNTRAQLESLIADNAALQARIDAVHSPTELERIAREEYGMVRPGETSYIVELDTRPVPLNLSGQEQGIDSRSLLERFWDFLTGRDLVPDE
jgi:cell division protein FtsB